MQYPQKSMEDEVNFLPEDKHESYKLILSFRVCAARHAQNTQSKKFAYLCNIPRKAWRMKLISCPKINTNVISWYYHLGCVQPGMPKIPKVRSLHIFAISPEKYGGWSWFFACKRHKTYLQGDSVCSQVCLKEPIQQICYFFAMSQRSEWWSLFLACR